MGRLFTSMIAQCTRVKFQFALLADKTYTFAGALLNISAEVSHEV